MKARLWFVVMSVLCMLSYGSVSHAEWNFGLGTGIFLLNAEGDQGFHTAIAGPVTLDVDLDPKDFQDATESAFGLAGYATDSRWMINYSVGQLKLEDDPSQSLPGGGSISSKLGFDVTTGELKVGYPVVADKAYALKPYVGVRYIKHELNADLIIVTAVPSSTTVLNRDIDEDWTDVLVGASLDIPFAQKFNWNITTDAGFGGSEGTYLGSTGLTWSFAKHWATTLYGKYMAVDFENGNRGDADWYLYDIDEFGVGLNILFNW